MKNRSAIAVAAMSLAAWAVPVWATPPSSVYYDRSPRHTDPWSDRAGPEDRRQDRGRAASHHESEEEDDSAAVKKLAEQVKELTRQVKELNERLGQSEKSTAPSQSRPSDRDGEGFRGREMGRMGSGRAGGLMGRMPMGRDGHGRPPEGFDRMHGDHGRPGPMSLGRGPGGQEEDGDRRSGPGTTLGRTRSSDEGKSGSGGAPLDQPERKWVTADGGKMPELPDGLKLEPGDKVIIIIRGKSEDDAEVKPKKAPDKPEHKAAHARPEKERDSAESETPAHRESGQDDSTQSHRGDDPLPGRHHPSREDR
jgi:hypothetical protein